MSRDDDARTFLIACGTPYSPGFPIADDLPSDQTVDTYRSRDNQLKYCHMYFAKQVALWRRIREVVEHDSEAPVWSIGAGPMLDLIGWFWESPSSAVTAVTACDVLTWSDVRILPSWSALVASTVGSFHYRDSVSLLAPTMLPQCANVPGLTALDPAQVPEGSNVFLPFVLNHILGRNTPAAKTALTALASWSKTLLSRGCRLVIADMHASKTAPFWATLSEALSVAASPQDFLFASSIASIVTLFADPRLQSRRGSNYLSVATVLVIEPERAFYVA